MHARARPNAEGPERAARLLMRGSVKRQKPGNRPPRHAAAGALNKSWLLKGTKQKFLDAFLASAKIEHIMPKVSAAAANLGRQPRTRLVLALRAAAEGPGCGALAAAAARLAAVAL